MSRPGDWHLVGLGSDPTPGESWGVRAVASVYANTAQAAAQTRQLIRSVESSTGTGVWHGDAGDAFRELIADFPSDIQACETSYQSARDAMNWWAGRLEDHQAAADRGLEQARAASSDVQAAQAALNTALANARTTSSALTDIERDAIRYKTAEPPAGVSAPTPSQIARARRASADAATAQRTAGNQVDDAQARLDAAARMVADAAAAYETDAQQTITKLDTAHDQALPENDIWEKIRRSGAWQVLVVIATVVVVVAAVAAFILTGPIAVIVGVIAVVAGVILAINDVLEWHAGLKSGWEAAFSVILTVIPGGVLVKGGKTVVAAAIRVGTRLAPRSTNAVVASLRGAARLTEAGHLRVTRFTDPWVDRINAHIPGGGTGGVRPSHQATPQPPVRQTGGTYTTSPASGQRLRAQLTGEEISSGHAFDKHVVERGEFSDLGITTREQFATHIEHVVRNGERFPLAHQGEAFWHDQTGTVVIRRASASDGGTAFRPANGRDYLTEKLGVGR